MRSETLRRTPLVRACAAAIAGGTLLLASACGTQTGDPAPRASDPTSSAASSTPSAPATSSPPRVPAGTPDCSAVWVAGKRLPAAYAGCAIDGALVKPHRVGCSSGQGYVLYDQRWWAV